MVRSDAAQEASSASSSNAPLTASTANYGAGGNMFLMQGKLMRRDRTFLTWKWRDFFLERGRLQYYSEKGIRKGEITLTPTTPITIRLLNEPKPYSFLLFIKDEKMMLAALNEMERRKWIDVFCDVYHASVEQSQSDKVDRRTRPTFLPIPDIQKKLTSSSSATDDAGENAQFNEGIPILESRMTYGPMKEVYSRVTFPPSLANGDLLVGVAPIVRRMGWTDERILAVGLYIDPEGATKELHGFDGRTAKSLYGDQTFYDHLRLQTTFRRSFVITTRKRVSKSVLIALLFDEISPRLGAGSVALETFMGFIEKSLKKAESMVLRINPDGRLEYRLRSQSYPPISSFELCRGIQGLFFDVNSIQHDAKRGLIERLPSLWGGEILDAQDEIFGSMDQKAACESDDEGDFDPELEDDDENDAYDDDDDDNLADDEIDPYGYRPSRLTLPRRTQSTREELDAMDEQEHEMLRSESRRVLPHFGPLIDPDSNVNFEGDLMSDGSALLGTWSQKIEVAPEEYDQPYDSHSYRFSVGLYVEPGGASECLLKYKGLSVGSIIQDPDFFWQFARGPFIKQFVFKVQTKISLMTLVDYLAARLQQGGSGSISAAPGDSSIPEDSKSKEFTDIFRDHQDIQLQPKNEIYFTVAADGKMTMRLRKRTSVSLGQRRHSGSGTDAFLFEDEVQLPPPPFATIFQGIFYGYYTNDGASRTQMMQRLPMLLDMAKDDLVHTYHDEIQVLKENYKRQKPENRVKVGYLSISFEKRKRSKTMDGSTDGPVTASKWAKRWCRLDGTQFSYFSHKRSRKARDVMDLTQCDVLEITSSSIQELAPFAQEKSANSRPSIKIAISKPNGEILALRTESIYEGEEWLESLIDASNVVNEQSGMAVWDGGMATGGRRRNSSEPRGSRAGSIAGRNGRAGSTIKMDGQNGDSTAESTEQELDDGDDALDLIALDKRGSLIAWVREDPRHAVIFGLMVCLVWMASMQRITTEVVLSA